MTEREGLVALLNGTRNVRRFRAEPVPEDALRGVLEVGRWSGSAMNRQPWELLVVREPVTLRALAATSPSIGWVGAAPLAILPIMAGEHRGEESFDEGRLSERLLLGARAHGLGAGLGWFPPGAPRAAAGALLGLPEGRQARTIVAVGYSAGGGGQGGERKPLAELVFRERFGEPQS